MPAAARPRNGVVPEECVASGPEAGESSATMKSAVDKGMDEENLRKDQNLGSDLSGIWAVTWRSVVFLPVMLATFVLFVSSVVLLLFPLFFGVVCLLCRLWWQGIGALTLWALGIWGLAANEVQLSPPLPTAGLSSSKSWPWTS